MQNEINRYICQKNNLIAFCKLFENDPFFKRLHKKCAKSANMTQKKFSNKFSMGLLKTQNFMLIANSMKWAQKML
jgi:hypothetical protein